jgi:hypothetical protein
MHWDAIGAVGEVAGAIAVVATLGYLATQIRQNTKMMKATIRQELSRGSQDGLIQFSEHARVLAKIDDANGPEWSDTEEAMEAELLTAAALRNWENYAWQYREGLLDSADWEGIVEDMRYRATRPYWVNQWQQTRMRYSSRLRETVDPIFGMDV